MINPANDPSLHRLSVGPLVMDIPARQAHLNGEPIHLSPLEFRALTYLARNAGRVVTKDELLAAVWQCLPEGKGTANVESCLKRLRRRLGA